MARRHPVGPNQLVLWPRHVLTEMLPPRRPRSGRLRAVRGQAGARIGENCWQAFSQVEGTVRRSRRGRPQPRRHYIAIWLAMYP